MQKRVKVPLVFSNFKMKLLLVVELSRSFLLRAQSEQYVQLWS